MRSRIGIAIALVIAACTAVEPVPANSPIADPATAPETIDRAPPASASRHLLGVLGERGRPTCPAGDTRRWLDVTPMIGSVSISGVPSSQLEPLMGYAVIADGTVTDPPPPAAASEPAEPCPVPQMRSDWIETPRGVVVRRGDPPDVSHFAVHALRRLTELSAAIDGDDVVITLANPLPDALTELRIVVHYEGCFGKPGTKSESIALADLDPAAVGTARVPALRPVDDDAPARARGRFYAAHSVQILATSPSATIDLDAPLATIGARVDCPAR